MMKNKTEDKKTSLSDGMILKVQKGSYEVELPGDITVTCRCGSRLRKNGIMPLAGDVVSLEVNPDGTGFITALKERKNKLVRPAVANIDLLAIVVASADPSPLYYNIDKLTAAAVYEDIDVCIIISKKDLTYGEEEKIRQIYESAGFLCFSVSTFSGEGTDELREFLKNRKTAFSGASGVGKSSLLNLLYPEIKAVEGELSQKIMRGKNTTRHTELYKVGENTYIADTPGFSKLYIEKDIPYLQKTNSDSFCLEISKDKLIFAFPEMAKYACECRYRDCTHTKEEGCAVLKRVEEGIIPLSRHQSYLKIYEEIK